MPIEITAAAKPPRSAAAPNASPGFSLARLQSRKISASDRMFFAERLELLLDTGSPLHTALETLEGQLDDSPLAPVLASLREGIAGGASFSQALSRHPEAFPETYVSLVAAGEAGGFLPEVLARLRESEEKRHELRGSLVGAFSYPAFLSVFSVGVVVFVLAVVFPKFAEIFEVIRDQLPWTTRFFMAASDSIRGSWPLYLAGLAGVALGVHRVLHSPRLRRRLEELLLRVPFLRELTVNFQMIQFLHTLGLSLENGVPLLDALRAGRDVVHSHYFRDFVDTLERSVVEGQGIAVVFAKTSFLPPLVGQMIATGEESSRLGLVTMRIAAFYEREWRGRLALIAKIVEPAMLLVMGVIVGLIVSSLLLPIFKLSTTVG